jgi:translation initiation factor 2 gamma subunit (eIF-2gamma)
MQDDAINPIRALASIRQPAIGRFFMNDMNAEYTNHIPHSAKPHVNIDLMAEFMAIPSQGHSSSETSRNRTPS